jgi:hypothetical protein
MINNMLSFSSYLRRSTLSTDGGSVGLLRQPPDKPKVKTIKTRDPRLKQGKLWGQDRRARVDVQTLRHFVTAFVLRSGLRASKPAGEAESRVFRAGLVRYV